MLFIQSWLKKKLGYSKEYNINYSEIQICRMFQRFSSSLTFLFCHQVVIIFPLKCSSESIVFWWFSLTFNCIPPSLHYYMVSILLSLPPFSPAILCWLHSITAARLTFLKDCCVFFFTSLGFLILFHSFLWPKVSNAYS